MPLSSVLLGDPRIPCKLLAEEGPPRSNFICRELRVPSVSNDAITFTCTLEARRETVYALAALAPDVHQALLAARLLAPCTSTLTAP